MKKIQIFLFPVTVLIAAVLAWQAIGKYIDIKTQEVKNQAVQGCLQVATYTFTNGKGVTTIEPIEKDYIQCLKLKGF